MDVVLSKNYCSRIMASVGPNFGIILNGPRYKRGKTDLKPTVSSEWRDQRGDEIEDNTRSRNRQNRTNERCSHRNHNTGGTNDPIQTRQTPSIGTSNPDQVRPYVWTRSGERSSRPISPSPLAQSREEVTELQGMVASLVDKTRDQEIAYRMVTNRLEQAEKELVEYRARSLEGIRSRSNPPVNTPISHSAGIFCTPDFSSARSGRYSGENSQQRPPSGTTYRNLSYNSTIGGQGSPNLPSQTQVRSEGVRIETPPPRRQGADGQYPNSKRTFQQTNKINRTRLDSERPLSDFAGSIPRQSDQTIDSDVGTFQNYIERNDAELRRIHAIMHMATSLAPGINLAIEETRRTPFTRHSTEECRAVLRNKEMNNEEGENPQEEEAPSTPKDNGKTKATSKKRSREPESESPNSPPPAPKKTSRHDIMEEQASAQ
ncbi:hypothetical protein F2Q69_00035794 [Brassica cretica]|uniref:Uncharacterized protein n=1 Tax=Brassica cretica TaxID=69181 RepID=A0A8S9SQ04_BRACR|nr:hypothetical protein F2Q69_00035794 [Brassica cretica]